MINIRTIDKLTLEVNEINCLVVTSMLRNNDIKVNCSFLNDFIIPQESPLNEFIAYFDDLRDVEDVISIFEQSISPDEKVRNGAIYTPKYIREYIVDKVFIEQQRKNKPIDGLLISDIACGCGAFLYTCACAIHKDTNLPYRDIFHRLYGIDISKESILRAKILLSLQAALEGEEVSVDDFRLYVGNTLDFNFNRFSNVKNNQGFDIVIGNPPYVRSKHIDDQSKKLLHRWKVANVGNPDLYLPFFEIGLSVLNKSGSLGYITVNSFFKSVNARAFRCLMQETKKTLSIIDFGEELVFHKKLAYTCLVFISHELSNHIDFTKATVAEICKGSNFEFEKIAYSTLDPHKGWNLNKSKVLANIKKMENCGAPLSSFRIRNGIATLANDVFIFKPKYEDGHYYYLEYNGVEHLIEKGICRDIIKPNILKDEQDMLLKMEKIIFPYSDNNAVFDEEHLKKVFPKAYAYLLMHKKKLLLRDKGDFDYKWYEYGRTQAIKDQGKKLLFPYMTDTPKFVFCDNENLMIYCGYAFYDESSENLLILKKILESKVFEYYIMHTSKPYSTGYYSYAKNYLKSFTICNLTEEEKQSILLMTKSEVDSFLINKYNVII